MDVEDEAARARALDSLLDYLKSNSRITSIPRYAFTLCGIKADYSCKPSTGTEVSSGFSNISSANPGATTVTQVLEILLKRTVITEAEVDLQQRKAKMSEEQVRQKCIQIKEMWSRVEEMEKVAVGTSAILKEMQVKLEEMEQETCRQRQRANENEQELSKVRRDFGVLRSSVDSLVNARETIRSMEIRIQEVERISERLSARVGGLEAGTRDKEVEVQKLMLENQELRAQLDFKESELAAVSDQAKQLLKLSL